LIAATEPHDQKMNVASSIGIIFLILPLLFSTADEVDGVKIATPNHPPIRHLDATVPESQELKCRLPLALDEKWV